MSCRFLFLFVFFLSHFKSKCLHMSVLIEKAEVYDTHEIENSPMLQPFFDIQPQIDQRNALRIHTLADVAREQAGDRPAPGRCDNSPFPNRG